MLVPFNLGRHALGLQAHFRFGFFVAAALVPDPLLFGASLVAGFAASRLLPANAPLFALDFGSERFRPSLDPVVPFSTLFDERPLLSVVFFAGAEDDLAPLLFVIEVVAFFKLDVDALGAPMLFFSTTVFTSVLLRLGGDLEVDLLVVGAAFAAGFAF